MSPASNTLDCLTDQFASTLLRRATQGDQDAWRALEPLCSKLTEIWCDKAEVNKETARDIRQEVLIKLFKNLPNYRCPETLRTQPANAFCRWLKTIVNNTLCDYFRGRGGREKPVAIGSWIEEALFFEPEEVAQGEWKNELLKNLLDEIEQACDSHNFQAFKMVVLEDRKPSEVAAALNLEVHFVYRAKNKILRRLRKRIQADENNAAKE